MLLQFSVQNFLSFRDETTFSMIASTDELHPNHILPVNQLKGRRVLRGAAIYGANGHGKTNLVSAIRFAQVLIVQGVEVNRPIIVRKFKLPSHKDEPASFIFTFNAKGIQYEYGIRVHRTHVAEEWLFYVPHGREGRLFERITTQLDNGEFNTDINLGPALRQKIGGQKSSGKKFMEFVASGTRPNQPFLTETIARNVDILRPVYDWFGEYLQVVEADSEFDGLETRAVQDADFAVQLSVAMKNAGIGIDRIEPRVRPVKIEDFVDMPQEAETRLDAGEPITLNANDYQRLIIRKNGSGELEIVELIFIYKRDDGTEVRFNEGEESAGTRRLLHLVPMIADLARSDHTYIVDELDRKLHPLLAYNLIETFYSSSNCGQLIFTTHNTDLLAKDLFRRDEIWFVEKKNDGTSELYSLAELKVRSDMEIRKGYLNGRFGAIPFLGDLSNLGWGEYDGKTQDHTEKPKLDRKITSDRDTKLFVIVTEGSHTEAIYFKACQIAFRMGRVKIRMVPSQGGNSAPQHIMQNAIDFKHKEDIGEGDELWVVIDVDDWPPEALHDVAIAVKRESMNLAVSNPCFELWLSLHLDQPLPEEISGRSLEPHLRLHLGSYSKTKYDARRLLERADDAIEKAKALNTDAKHRIWPQSAGSHCYKLVASIIKACPEKPIA